jgi:penicillin G amidase
VAVSGDMNTVGNTGSGPDWSATTGGGYRMIADLGSSPPRLLAVDAQSQSGHPGSPHYSDQLEDWLAGRYHDLPLVRAPESHWMQQILSPA